MQGNLRVQGKSQAAILMILFSIHEAKTAAPSLVERDALNHPITHLTSK